MSGFDGAYLKVTAGDRLTAGDMKAAFAALLAGEVMEIKAAAFLTALKIRGETPEEIAGAASAMREAAIRIDGPAGTLDTCGTGGTGLDTVNVSTATAIVLAGLGLPVAKHGNKAASSRSGSADVLSALGVTMAVPPAKAEAILEETGLVFLFAPNHHPGVGNIAPVRRALGFRTLFNLLGPLTNPAGAKRQLMGVYAPHLLRPVAEALRTGGAEAAFVVHGGDGLDELTVCDDSRACVLRGGQIEEITVRPEDAGVGRYPKGALRGGDPKENAAALRRLLEGEAGPYRDAVLLNAAAGLMVAERAESLRDGAVTAAGAIDDGRALAALERLKDRTA